ncbi:hypothetical protein G6011_01944 [Alternaria panax]|uniref:Uncharacterized protein n=1 Tax=Alternaria panax TaxID=48097 RepID=A0AAD4I8M4_9PLEO|nr:hypothetical protein G6011_01944 [Alternaria panax]
MAGPPSYPANGDFNSRPAPPSTPSRPNVASTPSAMSVADSSDNEFEPTPIHSPGGPQYEDLPPSYDEAQDQAVHDTRNGIAPVDPSQIEAHRITSNEGPNEPEVWEYRVRGEEPDPANEREQAPDYANHTSDKATSVPVQHISTSESISVGRVHSEPFPGWPSFDQLAPALLHQALKFARQEPDAAAQYAPHLNRLIAIPELSGPARSADEDVTFLVAYAQVLNHHSVKLDEFADFLYGLQVLCTAAKTTAKDLLDGPSYEYTPSTTVHDYIRGANEAFFAPRGLAVSFRSETALLEQLPIPAGHKSTVLYNLADGTATAEWRAQQLYPWIEALDTENIPVPSDSIRELYELSERFEGRTGAGQGLAGIGGHVSGQNRDLGYEDPPHSLPGPTEDPSHSPPGPGARHPRGQRGDHWSPFGMPGYGPFGAPGNGPFGPAGRGPFGTRGRSSRGRGRGRGSEWHGNEWAEVGKELGKIGEQFGKRMGDWGVEFGKRANAFGLDVGKMASGSGSGNGSQDRGTTSGQQYQQAQNDDLPPAYDPPAGQESGVLYGDEKSKVNTPGYSISTTTDDKGKGKAREKDHNSDDDGDDDGDDTSSLSSGSSISSDSDSDSDPDDDDDENFSGVDKDLDKDLARARKLSIRDARRHLKERSRTLKRQHRQKKRVLKAKHALYKENNTGKGKAKTKSKLRKDPEWKEAKKEYKAQRKALRKEQLAAKKEWREAREEARRGTRSARNDARAGGKGKEFVQEEVKPELVWLVIENLAL